MEGAQCWIYDDNETACDLEPGCEYNTMEQFGKADEMICEINFTLVDNIGCWNYYNESSCNAQNASGCIWMSDPWCEDHPSDPWCTGSNGWCDFKLWSCHQYGQNKTACEADPVCGWQNDWWCETPEGQNIGLRKNLALLARVTYEAGTDSVFKLLTEEGVK